MKSILAGIVFSTCLLQAQTSGKNGVDSPWQALQFLVGDWVGEGGGGPGQGTGDYSFSPDLQGKILVRKNHADYPAANGRPAFSHDDLMIVFKPSESGPLRAIYFDSEGHTIRYGVTVPTANTVVFESEASSPGPRYRLTYALTGKALNGKFEMADAGKTEYKPYLTWTSARRP
jgi:hypothetical protein